MQSVQTSPNSSGVAFVTREGSNKGPSEQRGLWEAKSGEQREWPAEGLGLRAEIELLGRAGARDAGARDAGAGLDSLRGYAEAAVQPEVPRVALPLLEGEVGEVGV